MAKLWRELRKAGSNEIGGVLAGEALGNGHFLVLDLSVQRDGSFANFSRSSTSHDRFMQHFFKRTGHNYERFNYLGEWHSHPSFPAWPSSTDFLQMQGLAEDPDQQANFLALLVVKLSRDGKIEGTAHAFRRGRPPIQAGLSASNAEALCKPVSGWRHLLKSTLLWRDEPARVSK